MPRLDGKVAVVTGAAAGPKAALGAIFAKALAPEGAKVVLADTKDCAPVAAEIAAKGGTAHAVRADVRDAMERPWRLLLSDRLPWYAYRGVKTSGDTSAACCKPGRPTAIAVGPPG